MVIFSMAYKENKAKAIAVNYVAKRFAHDYSDCEITVEDNGVFWVVLFNGKSDNVGYPQVIIKKRNGRVLNCFIKNRPNF